MKTLAIARVTVRELWRQRNPWGFLAVGLAMIVPAFIPAELLQLVPGQVAPMLLEKVLQVAQFIAVLLAISMASGLISSDIERGTHLLVVTKPLGRMQVILGKLVGAGIFMLGAWLFWGLIAALAMTFRFGPTLWAPTFFGFAASSLGSWLVIAYCLFWSSLMPANATMGIALLGWFLMTNLARSSAMATALGHPGLGRILTAIGWIFPVDALSAIGQGIATGSFGTLFQYLALSIIFVWAGLAVLAFSIRDLASRG